MVRKPDFRLEAAGKNITAQIKKNLISLTYNDKQGAETDDLTLTLHGLFEKKPFGSDLKLFLGYEGNLFYCGVFFLQTFKKDYLNKTTEITATSADFASTLKVKKVRLWGNTNLEKIARKIAREHNMGCKTDRWAADVKIDSLIQENVSDLEFLYTLCNTRAFFCMQKDNAFVIHAKPTLSSTFAETEQEMPLPLFTLKLTELTSLTIEEANRDNYDAVVFEWHDRKENTNKTVQAGQGSLVYRVMIPEPKDPSEALQQAQAKLRDLQKEGIKGALETVGQRLLTGARVKIDTINQEFLITSVTHNLSDSYTISVEFEG